MDVIDGQYKILAKLGQGGMGVVYKVRHIHTNRIFALKMMTEKLSTKHTVLKKEFSCLAHLRHPNLCRVYDFGIHDHNPYFVMEYLAGKNILKAFVNVNTRYESFVPAVIHILRALNYLHSKGVIHGDLKPQNIIYTRNKIKLIDFGLTSFLSSDKAKTGGTLPYIAPEVILKGQRDLRSDLYSLGVILYEVVSGRLPFKCRNVADIIAQGSLQPIPLKNLPLKLSAIIAKLMASDAEKRFSSSREVIKAISKRYSVETRTTKQAYLYAPRIVGRQKEIKRIKRISEKVRQGKANLIFVTGEKGIGKSRLLEEIKIWAETNGFRVLIANCQNDAISYEPYRKILFDIGKKKVFKPPLPPKFNLMNSIGDAIGIFLEIYGPCLLILEDVDRADELTIELTSFLSRKLESRSILIIASCIKIPPHFKNILKFSKGYHEVVLNPLSRSAVSQLITQMTSISSTQLVRFVYENSTGNPLFVREIIRTLIQKNLVRFGRQEINEKKLGKVSLPSSLQEMTQRMLDSLDRESIRLLKIASFMEQGFTSMFLTNLLGKGKNLVEKNIAMLKKKGLLTQVGKVYYLRHIIHKEQLQEMIEDEEKKSLHRKIAQYSEKKKRKNIQHIAWHYMQAGAKKKAIYYGFRAAQEAMNNHNQLKALEIYRNLEKFVAQKTTKKLEILTKSGDILRITGQYNEAVKTYQSAEELAIRCKDIGCFKLKKAYILQLLARYDEAIEQIKKAEQLFKAGSEDWIEAQNTLAGVLLAIGKYSEALNVLFKIEKTGYAVPRVQRNIGIGLINLGRLNQARKRFLMALKIARDDKSGLSSCNSLGIVCIRKGMYREAVKWFEKALIIAKRTGNVSALSTILNNLSGIYAQLGDKKKCLKHLNSAHEIAFDVGNPEALVRTLNNRGAFYLENGDTARAKDDLSRAVRIGQKIGYQNISSCLSNLGRYYYFKGRYKKAVSCYKKATRQAKRQGSMVLFIEGLFYIIEISCEMGMLTKAMKNAKKAQKIVEIIKSPVYNFYLLHWLSKIEQINGNIEQAINLANDSIDLARKVGKKELIISLIQLSTIYLDYNDLGKLFNIIHRVEEYIHDSSDMDVLSMYHLLKAKIEFSRHELAASVRCLSELAASEEHSCQKPDLLQQVFFLRGKVYERLGKIDDAAAAFHNCVEVLDDISSRMDNETRNYYLFGQRSYWVEYIEEFLKK